MRVVLIGGGGREAALAWRISQSPSLTELVVTHPGPGWPRGVVERAASSVAEQVAVARDVGADLVVVGPEGPLAAGIADALAEAGVPCFGPRRDAARLESSKAFTKEICAAAGVPTARAIVVSRDDPASWERGRARCAEGDVVVKADGLAAGKGVVVCREPDEALAALSSMERFGAAATRLVLEDRLEGPEVSVFALCDGRRAVALPSSQDHKTLLDGGAGPNTGGMGAYAPCPLVSASDAEELVATVHQPVIDELARRGTPFCGALFAGFMLTAEGPQLLEFNARFGDPEAQALMVLWDDDVLPWLAGAAAGALPEAPIRFSSRSACCVVLASAGYPASSDKGQVIPEPGERPDVVVFHAATRRGPAGALVTDGGRVLGITGVGDTLAEARARAYGAVDDWRFAGVQFRTDIGAAAAGA